MNRKKHKTLIIGPGFVKHTWPGLSIFFVTGRSIIRKKIKDSMYYNDNFAKKNKVQLLPSIQARTSEKKIPSPYPGGKGVARPLARPEPMG